MQPLAHLIPPVFAAASVWIPPFRRVIQQYMIDMENLLQLLDTSGKVTDSPTAKDLVLSRGDVVFDQVSFAYDPAMTVLKSVGGSGVGVWWAL